MLHRTLNIPDHPAWHADPSFSPQVAASLVAAYRFLKAQDYQNAQTALAPISAHPMSLQQRLRVCYATGLLAAQAGATQEALKAINTGLDIAVELDDLVSSVFLYYLRGVSHRDALHFTQVSEDYHACLALMSNLREGKRTARDASAADFEAEIVITLAANEFLLAHYATTEHLLEHAQRLFAETAPRETQGTQITAPIAWTRALLWRWRGAPETALRYAIAAAEVYEAEGVGGNTARIQTVVAEIALDLAESFADRGRQTFLTLASPYIASALQGITATQDAAGAALALLASMRYSRLTNGPQNRESVLSGLLVKAEQLSDSALQGQVYTALGHEILAHGETSRGLACYRKALDVFAAGEATALGVWAHRALLAHERSSEALRDEEGTR